MDDRTELSIKNPLQLQLERVNSELKKYQKGEQFDGNGIWQIFYTAQIHNIKTSGLTSNRT